MQQTGKATPRPYLVGVTLENVAIIEDRHENAAENAALIVRAVNAHDDLVAALTWMVDQFEDYHDTDLEPHQVEQLDGWRAAMDVLDGKSWTPPKAEGA